MTLVRASVRHVPTEAERMRNDERGMMNSAFRILRSAFREYWLIDSRPGRRGADTSTGLSASFWVRDAQGRFQAADVDEEGVYRSTVLPGFWLRVDWLWQEELPDPLLTFAEIVGPSRVMEALRELVARGPQTGREA